VILVSRGLETGLSWALEQSQIPTIFRTIIYAAGGWIGYLLGVVIATGFAPTPIDFGEGRYHFVYSLVGCAIGAVIIGLMLHHNRKRNDRLLASIARLKEHEFAEKELEIARSMQQRLLPPACIERDGFRVTARTHAAHLVGGDFYDVLRLGDATVILAADVAGKGIAASLIMATCKAMVPFLASTGDAADVMQALNIRLCEQLQRREFVAMVFVRFDPRSGEAQIVNAGMPDPLVIDPNGLARAVTFTGDRLPLGAMRVSRYEATSITLARGERLLLFSDGLPEATLAPGSPLGYEHVEELAAKATSVDELIEQVRRVATVDDDLTVVAIERT